MGTSSEAAGRRDTINQPSGASFHAGERMELQIRIAALINFQR